MNRIISFYISLISYNVIDNICIQANLNSEQKEEMKEVYRTDIQNLMQMEICEFNAGQIRADEFDIDDFYEKNYELLINDELIRERLYVLSLEVVKIRMNKKCLDERKRE